MVPTALVRVRLAERPLPRSVSRRSPEDAGLTPVLALDQRPLGLTVKNLDAASIRRLTPARRARGRARHRRRSGRAGAPGAHSRRATCCSRSTATGSRRSTSFVRVVVDAARPVRRAALLVYDRLADQRALYAIVASIRNELTATDPRHRRRGGHPRHDADDPRVRRPRVSGRGLRTGGPGHGRARGAGPGLPRHQDAGHGRARGARPAARRSTRRCRS